MIILTVRAIDIRPCAQGYTHKTFKIDNPKLEAALTQQLDPLGMYTQISLDFEVKKSSKT